MNTPLTKSKRIIAFHRKLIRKIPRFPNTKESLVALEQKPIASLLVDYINWRMRYVAVRPRTVIIDTLAQEYSGWLQYQNIIEPFLEKVKRGEDLTPHLSLLPHTRGFSPAAGLQQATPEERWSDKDMMLNTMGFYHFHPSISIEPGGFATRTNEIILARVTREQFIVIGLFVHSVFESTPDGKLTQERERLWRVFDEYSMRGVSPGTVVMPGPGITTSGHSLNTVFLAQDYARCLIQADTLVETKDFQANFFTSASVNTPKNPKWEWLMNHLDLALYERKSNTIGLFRKGPN